MSANSAAPPRPATRAPSATAAEIGPPPQRHAATALSSSLATELFRPGLLEGASILCVTAPARVKPAGESFAGAVFDVCEALGADVHTCSCASAVTEEQIDAQIQAASADTDPQDGTSIVLFDGPALFAAGGLNGCLDVAWSATRAIVNLRLLPAGRGARIVYLAPSDSAGEGAEGARAALENLTRTLSVEWARHQITLVTLALADTSTTQQVAALVAYLASPAGAYFSGCQLDLRGV